MPDRLTDWAGWLRQKINYYTTTLMALGLIIRAQIHRAYESRITMCCLTRNLHTHTYWHNGEL